MNTFATTIGYVVMIVGAALLVGGLLLGAYWLTIDVYFRRSVHATGFIKYTLAQKRKERAQADYNASRR